MQENTLVIRQQKLPFLLSSLPLCELLLPIEKTLFEISSKAPILVVFLLFLSSVTGFLLYRLAARLFFNEGTITVDKTGFTIQGLLNPKRFYTWAEIISFRIANIARSTKQYPAFDTDKKKGLSLGGVYPPLSNQDMIDLFENLKNHYLLEEPLKNFSSYPEKCGLFTLENFINFIISLFLLPASIHLWNQLPVK